MRRPRFIHPSLNTSFVPYWYKSGEHSSIPESNCRSRSSLSLSPPEVAVSWQCPLVSRSICRRLVQCCIVSLMRKYPAWSYGDMVCLIRFSSIFKTNMVCPTIRMLGICGMFRSSLGMHKMRRAHQMCFYFRWIYYVKMIIFDKCFLLWWTYHHNRDVWDVLSISNIFMS